MKTDDLQYYLDTEKRDKKHENEPLPIIHTGIEFPFRQCPYCNDRFASLKELGRHIVKAHPGNEVKVK